MVKAWPKGLLERIKRRPLVEIRAAALQARCRRAGRGPVRCMGLGHRAGAARPGPGRCRSAIFLNNLGNTALWPLGGVLLAGMLLRLPIGLGMIA